MPRFDVTGTTARRFREYCFTIHLREPAARDAPPLRHVPGDCCAGKSTATLACGLNCIDDSPTATQEGHGLERRRRRKLVMHAVRPPASAYSDVEHTPQNRAQLRTRQRAPQLRVPISAARTEQRRERSLSVSGAPHRRQKHPVRREPNRASAVRAMSLERYWALSGPSPPCLCRA
jgi:hypothetical protein